jgi:hypothetical protein
VVRRPRFRRAYLVVIGLLLWLVGIHALRGGQPAEEPATIAGLSPPMPGPLDRPAVVFEDKGRIEILEKVRIERVRAANIEVQPLSESDARVKLGETAKLKFAARDRISRVPESGANVSVSVFHGDDPPRRLTLMRWTRACTKCRSCRTGLASSRWCSAWVEFRSDPRRSAWSARWALRTAASTSSTPCPSTLARSARGRRAEEGYAEKTARMAVRPLSKIVFADVVDTREARPYVSSFRGRIHPGSRPAAYRPR